MIFVHSAIRLVRWPYRATHLEIECFMMSFGSCIRIPLTNLTEASAAYATNPNSMEHNLSKTHAITMTTHKPNNCAMLLTTSRYYILRFGLAGVDPRSDVLGPYSRSSGGPKQTV